MGLFSKGKKNKPDQLNKTDKPEKAADRTSRMDALVRPGGVFLMQLLMKERCELPSAERMTEVLAGHLGRMEAVDRKSVV